MSSARRGEAVGRVRELESALNRSQSALAQAEQRAQLAEKAAQDAWAFARAVMLTKSGEMPNPVADRLAERVLCRNCGQPFERVRPHQAFCRPSRRKRILIVGAGVGARLVHDNCGSRRSGGL
jgi:hypothetical protein